MTDGHSGARRRIPPCRSRVWNSHDLLSSGPGSVVARIMGFDPKEIGYLHHAIADGLGEGSLDRIRILGDHLEDCVRPFEPHPNYQRQRDWKKVEVEELRASRM